MQDAVEVHLVEVFLLDGSLAGVIAVEDAHDRVVVLHAGTGIAVGEEGGLAVHQAAEYFLVTAWGGEVEVGELEEGLKVLHAARTAHAFGFVVEVRAHAHLFAGQHLLKGALAEVGHARTADDRPKVLHGGDVAVGIDVFAAWGED